MRTAFLLHAFGVLTLLASTGCGLMAQESPVTNVQPLPKTISVNPDGTGDFKTVQEAINSVPERNESPVVIGTAPGRYNEQLLVPRSKPHITLKGAGRDRTQVLIVAGVKETPTTTPAGVRVDPSRFEEVTLTAEANNLRVENLTLENAAGATSGPNQALRASGDRHVYENVVLLGWQDTLYLNKANTRHYFSNCDIWGSVDFIYGPGTAVFERCKITQRRETGGPATAPSTPQEVANGLVFLDCHIVKGTGVKENSSTLMRPWREFGHAAFINCVMDDHITAKGWSEWGGREATCRAEEFGSKTPDGKAIDLSKRAPRVKILTPAEAAKYTVANVLGGTGREKPFGEKARVVTRPVAPIEAAPGRFPAQNATLYGTNARLENSGANANFGFWSDTDTSFEWPSNVAPGVYRVALNYALDPAQAGSEIQVAVGGKIFKLTPPATGGWGTYKTVEIGEVEIKEAGVPVTVSALSQKGTFILNLHEVTLSKKS